MEHRFVYIRRAPHHTRMTYTDGIDETDRLKIMAQTNMGQTQCRAMSSPVWLILTRTPRTPPAAIGPETSERSSPVGRMLG